MLMKNTLFWSLITNLFFLSCSYSMQYSSENKENVKNFSENIEMQEFNYPKSSSEQLISCLKLLNNCNNLDYDKLPSELDWAIKIVNRIIVELENNYDISWFSYKQLPPKLQKLILKVLRVIYKNQLPNKFPNSKTLIYKSKHNFAIDEKRVAISNKFFAEANLNEVRIYDLSKIKQKAKDCFKIFNLNEGRIESIAINDLYLVVGYYNCTKIFDILNGRQLVTLSTPGFNVAISKDSNFVITTSDVDAKLWSTQPLKNVSSYSLKSDKNLIYKIKSIQVNDNNDFGLIVEKYEQYEGLDVSDVEAMLTRQLGTYVYNVTTSEWVSYKNNSLTRLTSSNSRYILNYPNISQRKGYCLFENILFNNNLGTVLEKLQEAYLKTKPNNCLVS